MLAFGIPSIISYYAKPLRYLLSAICYLHRFFSTCARLRPIQPWRCTLLLASFASQPQPGRLLSRLLFALALLFLFFFFFSFVFASLRSALCPPPTISLANLALLYFSLLSLPPCRAVPCRARRQLLLAHKALPIIHRQLLLLPLPLPLPFNFLLFAFALLKLYFIYGFYLP